jgi:hypothetical protein
LSRAWNSENLRVRRGGGVSGEEEVRRGSGGERGRGRVGEEREKVGECRRRRRRRGDGGGGRGCGE